MVYIRVYYYKIIYKIPNLFKTSHTHTQTHSSLPCYTVAHAALLHRYPQSLSLSVNYLNTVKHRPLYIHPVSLFFSLTHTHSQLYSECVSRWCCGRDELWVITVVVCREPEAKIIRKQEDRQTDRRTVQNSRHFPNVSTFLEVLIRQEVREGKGEREKSRQ